jgi:transcriptional regulator PpsR
LNVELITGHVQPVEAARHFTAPQQAFGDLDATTAATLIAATADVALVVDSKGVVRDLAFGSDDLTQEGYDEWRGRPWIDTVTVESRPKVESLLRDATTTTPTRRRQVNHLSPRGADFPVLYSAMQIRRDGPIIAVGRDLRAMATLQQRLVDAQLSMERDYTRLRHAETRYRLLFQLTSEAVLILDAGSRKVIEANPAACRLLDSSMRQLVSRAFPKGFDPDSTRLIESLLVSTLTAGRTDDIRIRSADGKRRFLISASLFRQDDTAYYLVRLSPLQADVGAPLLSSPRTRLLDVFDGLPDGLVITDPEGRVLTANRAFLDLAQLATEEQARGQPLERWLGRPGIDLGVLLSNLRQHGVVRLFSTTMRGEYGSSVDIEISAVSVPGGEQPCLGFAVRNVGRRLTFDTRVEHELPRSVKQLTELVGRVSLKEMVRETTDVIERLCIEAALELTADNRASAAEMLGLSRQSLYVKLRRYGLGDLASDSETDMDKP